MEEKKLTDEEIVKDIERSTGMPSYWKKIVLDFIYRLQADKIQLKWNYVDLKEKYVKVLDLNEKVIAEQKAEIEQLTEEKDKYQEKWQTSYMNELNLQKQVDELNKENARLDKNVKWFQEKIENGEFVSKQAVKDTAKDLLIEFNEWINGQYDAKLDTYSVHIPVHEVNDFLTEKAKEYGVEM